MANAMHENALNSNTIKIADALCDFADSANDATEMAYCKEQLLHAINQCDPNEIRAFFDGMGWE
jgi:hypothetical protein